MGRSVMPCTCTASRSRTASLPDHTGLRLPSAALREVHRQTTASGPGADDKKGDGVLCVDSEALTQALALPEAFATPIVRLVLVEGLLGSGKIDPPTRFGLGPVSQVAPASNCPGASRGSMSTTNLAAAGEGSTVDAQTRRPDALSSSIRPRRMAPLGIPQVLRATNKTGDFATVRLALNRSHSGIEELCGRLAPVPR
jgi:hypothetical protein